MGDPEDYSWGPIDWDRVDWGGHVTISSTGSHLERD